MIMYCTHEWLMSQSCFSYANILIPFTFIDTVIDIIISLACLIISMSQQAINQTTKKLA